MKNNFNAIAEITESKHCKELGRYITKGFDTFVDVTKSKHYNGLGRYISRGYDTYGLFKLVGGLQKGNLTEEEIKRAVDFYKNLL